MAALTIGVAAPAGAQESLGLEINITEGGPGEIVAGQVNTDDVAEHCTTTVEGLQEEWGVWFNDVLGDVEGELFQTFFPGADFIDLENLENFDQAAYAAVALLVFGAILDIEGAAGDLLAGTFIMTFADIATQEPVGEISNFDPNTGEGTVVVPDIEPGLWAVAAACITPIFDVPTLIAGVEAGGDYLEGLGIPVEELPLQLNLSDLEPLFAFLQEHGPALLQPMVEPKALGFQIFCILDAEGLCPADEVPEELPDDEAPGPARPVVVQPAFTG